VLNEGEALPEVLGAMRAGFRGDRGDNGSDDGSADLARELGATVVVEPRRGFGAACYAGLVARSPTSSASWTATARSIRATCRSSPTRSPPRRPTS
jgi:hypothetical protein